MTDEVVRAIDTENGEIVLVGVVHDHPASFARVERVVEATAPAAIGLEIPPITLPVFRAAVSNDAPDDEFTAAIKAAPGAKAVGIDFPSVSAVSILLRKVAARRDSIGTTLSLVRKAVAVTRRAVVYRLSLAASESPDGTLPAHPIQYDCPPDAPPVEQAAHEEKLISQSKCFLGAIDTPPAMEAFDEVRESNMARQIERLADHGPVVAVIGFGHLDGVQDRLTST